VWLAAFELVEPRAHSERSKKLREPSHDGGRRGPAKTLPVGANRRSASK
jgi:hypothetical protein